MTECTNRPGNGAALGAILAAAGATAGVSFITVNRLKDAVVASSLRGEAIRVSDVLSTLGPMDAAVAGLAILTCVVLVCVEMRQRALTRLLHTATEAEAVALLTILLAWVGHSYLNPGVLLGGDTGTHISRFFEVARGLDSGRLPLWTNYQYAGAPLLWFTGPLTYVAGGMLAFLLHDAVLATKALLFALHMLSGWVFYALLRRVGIKPVSALVIAVAFAGCFAHLHLFLYRGVIPQAFTIVFVVSLFYGADGLLRNLKTRWTNFLILALSTAALIINHQPHALFAAAYLGLFGLVLLALGTWTWRGIPLVITAGLLGAVASAIAILPVLNESDWVMIEPEGAMFQFHLPTATRLLNLVAWRDTRTTWGIDYWAYLGLGLVGFSAVGTVALARNHLDAERRSIALACCACIALGLFMYNPVVRDIIFLMFFLGVLAALGLDWLLSRALIAGRRLLYLTALIVADLASTSIQPVARTDKAFLVEAGRRLEQTAPSKRFVQIAIDGGGNIDADKGPDGSPVSYYSTVQRIAGNHNMAATRLHNYLLSAAGFVQGDIQNLRTLTSTTRSILGLFNVGEVICANATTNGCPGDVSATRFDPVLGNYIEVSATPVLFSQMLVPLRLELTLEKPMLWPGDFLPDSDRHQIVEAVAKGLLAFVAAERPDFESKTVEQIGIHPEANPNSTRVNEDLLADVRPWHPEILDYSVSLDRVFLKIKSDRNGYAQLAHPWFPSTLVTINGDTVQPIRGAINMLVVPIATGPSEIVLRDGPTTTRTIASIVSILGFVAIFACATGLAWNGRQITAGRA